MAISKKTLPPKVKLQVKKYLAILKKDNLPIQKAFVYGSYAKGTPHKWSDIDVCIVSSRFTSTWSAIEYLWSHRPFDVRYTIEPIGFSTKDFREGSPLVNEIKRTGVPV
ncbi:MAG: nucleotidyltransferase domain-containing protein [Candidatus Uhrbacteria bacterium]|nr:nucleotidyltransferase domain-containing protein [Candidatus Uhrbacteria bacterium]